jgi:hypothetical protein
MTAPQPKDDAALQRHMVRGSAWTISVRWSLRFLGLISTIILARLLTPADYGIVAIASMIVGIVRGLQPHGPTVGPCAPPQPDARTF